MQLALEFVFQLVCVCAVCPSDPLIRSDTTAPNRRGGRRRTLLPAVTGEASTTPYRAAGDLQGEGGEEILFKQSSKNQCDGFSCGNGNSSNN